MESSDEKQENTTVNISNSTADVPNTIDSCSSRRLKQSSIYGDTDKLKMVVDIMWPILEKYEYVVDVEKVELDKLVTLYPWKVFKRPCDCEYGICDSVVLQNDKFSCVVSILKIFDDFCYGELYAKRIGDKTINCNEIVRFKTGHVKLHYTNTALDNLDNVYKYKLSSLNTVFRNMKFHK